MTITDEKVLSQFHKVINKVLFLKRKDLFEFEGIRFFPSEIHLMIVVDEQRATNATKIGEQLGVTKGAVSQTLSRLEKKGVLVKKKDPYRKNELTLTFTALGKRAFSHYKRKTGEVDRKQLRWLAENTEDEKRVIHGFLRQCEKALDDLS